MRAPTKPPRHERGAAAVEFALVLPVFLLLVLGAIDWGYYFYVEHVVTGAAREGARAGALEYDPAVCRTITESTVRQYLLRIGLRGTPTLSRVACGLDDGAEITPGVPAVEITVSYPVGSLTGFLGNSGMKLVPDAAFGVAAMRAEE